MKSRVNLYIDESGVGNIVYPKYKYFLMSSVVMTEEEEDKAFSFFSCWKRKYVLKPDAIFHSADFFEDNVDKKGRPILYRKKKLNKIKYFKEATDELINLIKYLRFKSNVYYIDLEEVLKQLKLNKKSPSIIKDIINKDFDKRWLFPIYTVSKFLYKDHEKQLKNKNYGFVCYESQKENDVQIVESFHEHLAKMQHKNRTYVYGKNVLGLNFYNKASVCAALEIADFIAYSTTQELRNVYKRGELSSFNEERLEILLNAYNRIKKYFRISVINVTKESVQDFVELQKRVKILKEKQQKYQKNKKS